MKKNLIFISVGLLLTIALVYFLIPKPPKPATPGIPINVKSSELFKAYEANEDKADELYLDREVKVTGEVGEILEDSKGAGILILKGEDDFFGVKCNMVKTEKKKVKKIKEGDIVTIMGTCTGGGGGLDVELQKCKMVK